MPLRVNGTCNAAVIVAVVVAASRPTSAVSLIVVAHGQATMAASSTSKRGPGQGQAQGAQAGDENEDKVPLQAIVMCDNTDALKSWQPLCRPAAPDSDSDSDGEQEDDQPWVCLLLI